MHTLPRLMAMLLLLPACGDKGDDTGTPVAPPDPCTDCVLLDANNYSYSATFDITAFEVEEQADVEICWDGLTTNIRGETIDPVTDVEQVQLVVFLELSPEEVGEGLAQNTISQSDATIFVSCEPGESTCCSLSEFELFGNALDINEYFTEERGGSWLLNFSDGSISGTQMTAILLPRVAATATEVDIGDDTATLDVNVDLSSLTPVVVTPNTPALTMDWTGVTTTGLGNKLDLRLVDRLLLGSYSSTVAEMEDRVWEIETGADSLFEVEVSGGEADLSGLTGTGTWAGVDSGTWLMALYCSACTNPAPRFVTVLEVP